MMNFVKTILTVTASILALTATLTAQGDVAEDIMKQAHLNLFYAGDDGMAEVVMTIVNSKGRARA
jgi:hypothetical protein